MNVCNRNLENYHTVGRSIICAIRSEFSVLNGEQSTLHFITHGKSFFCSLDQWRTQECFSGGVQQIQLRTERTGIWGW